MSTTLRHEVESLENVIFVCFGQPTDEDLPQIANDEGVILELVQGHTGRPMYEIEGDYHHQTDNWIN